jgi:hypothetical protein
MFGLGHLQQGDTHGRGATVCDRMVEKCIRTQASGPTHSDRAVRGDANTA